MKLRQPRIMDGRCQPERMNDRTIRGFDYRETSHFRLFRRVSGFFMRTDAERKYAAKAARVRREYGR